METILFTEIPIQMISVTDTDGKITPLRFRFLDQGGELITVKIDEVLKVESIRSTFGISYTCAATIYGTRKTFVLRYDYYNHDWKLTRYITGSH